MMDDPIDQSSFKSDVPARLFALDPFVPEDFLFLGAECLVKSVFFEAFRGTLKSKFWHDAVGLHRKYRSRVHVKYQLNSLRF